MEFLYLGASRERHEQLKKALNRLDLRLERTDTPEYAFFKVIHREIDAVFLDLTEPEMNGEELINDIESIGEEVEVVLISDPHMLNGFHPDRLRFCFGYLTPNLEAGHNSMVLHQLTDRLNLKSRLEMLKNSATVDGLTRLHNHAYFQQQLEQEIQDHRPGKEPISLVIFDIDHFKHYNDTNGHPAGDKVLVKVAELLQSAVRKIDLTARYGGEEFVIVLPGVKLKTALMVTERLRAKIMDSKFEFGHLQPMGFVSASFGVATLDHNYIKEKTDLIGYADKALYKAKSCKRNCIWYFHHIDYHHFQASLL